MGLVAKAFQDIITFSRASAGTYVNSNGYITNSSVLNYLTYSNQPENAAWTKSNSFVQTNLLIYSQEFDNAAWGNVVLGTAVAPTVTANQGIAPDGTLTADRVQFSLGGGTTTSDITRKIATAAVTTIGASYTHSIWVRSYDGVSNYTIHLTDAAGITNNVAVSGTWTRIPVTGVAGAASTQVAFGLRGGQTPTNSNTADLLVWGAQLVQGSVPGDYRATTSAALPVLYADYQGVVRARKLCENAAATIAHFADSSTSTIAAGVYSGFAKLKAGERTSATMYLVDSSGIVSGTICTFNLNTGVVTAGTQASIVSVGNGYFQCLVYGTCAAGAGAKLRVLLSDGSAYTGDGSSGIYIADAQLNDGSSALAYYDTTASAYNAPRFDYDPVTLAAKGLLVEESRANLLLQSNDFQTSWTPTNITRTLNSTLSPSGNVDGVKIAATAAAGTSLLQTAVVAATSVTGSVYAKQGTGATIANTFLIRNATTATILLAGTLNYSTGVFTYTTGVSGATATNVGNGWWRLQLSVTTGITSGDSIGFYTGWAGVVATAGDFLYAYGAQLEAGAFATSYIPTVASQVTRAADVASVNTLSPWYNSVAGTLYAEFSQFQATSGTSRLAWIDDVDTALYQNFVSVGNNTINTEGNVYVGGAAQATLFRQTVTANTVGKTAFAFTANDFAECFNGGAVATDTAGTLPSGLDKMWLGTYRDSTYLNGHLRRITYYPRRLTNAELQTLTTL